MSDDYLQTTVEADPDPFTVMGLVVACVAMVAQLVSLKLQFDSNSRQRPTTQGVKVALEKLRDSIEDAIRDVERLIRVLGNPVSSTPLSDPFEFSRSRLFLSIPDFDRYRDLVAQMGLRAGELSTWTLQLIRTDAEFAGQLGHEIATEINDIVARINKLHRDAPSNEFVLEECLHMLRAFNNILSRIDREN